jgi:hypothetical protein
MRLGAGTLTGSVVGAILLLVLPPGVFAAVVPALILLACLLVVIQPWLVRRLADRPRGHHGGPLVWLAIFATGMYGGYFGAAQGVLLIAVLAVGLDETLQRANAAKNVLGGLANLVAGVLFIVLADVNWAAAGLVAAGATVGGLLGARVGRRLAPAVLRAIVVLIGIIAVVTLV